MNTVKSIYITQGEEAVGDDPGLIVSTILGSCVAVCLWDPIAKVGGINHLLLPEMKSNSGSMDTAGAVAMDRLINQMMPLGAIRSRLRGKLFGGSSMLSGMTDIGARNAAFGRAYLANEGIPTDAENVGGTSARKLKFWPATGAVRMKIVADAPELKPVQTEQSNEVELF